MWDHLQDHRLGFFTEVTVMKRSQLRSDYRHRRANATYKWILNKIRARAHTHTGEYTQAHSHTGAHDYADKHGCEYTLYTHYILRTPLKI